jgi:hypothetical protein
MSIRTVIEINHDYLRDIADDPARIVDFVMRLGSGLGYAKKVIPNGMRVLAQRHHSDKITLTVE